MSQKFESTSIGMVTAFCFAVACPYGAPSNASPAAGKIIAVCDMTKTRSWVRGKEQEVHQLQPDSQVMKQAYYIDNDKKEIFSVMPRSFKVPPFKAKDVLIDKDRVIAYFQGDFISEIVEINLADGKVKAEAIGRGPIRLAWTGNCSLR